MKNSISQNSEFLDKEIGNFQTYCYNTLYFIFILKYIHIIEERHSNAYQKVHYLLGAYQHLHIINTIDNIIEDTDNKC